MREKLKHIFWNKAIRNSLIAACWFLIISQIAIIIWSRVSNIDFFQVYQNIFAFLNKTISIKVWTSLIIIFTSNTLTYLLFNKKRRSNKREKEEQAIKEPEEKVQEEIKITEEPTVFFHHRFIAAFPGFTQGYQEFKSKKDIINRLKVLLASPLFFDNAVGHGIDNIPIWWFRGGSALYIKKFKVLNRQKILLNSDELIIEKVIAYRGSSYYQDFVYVECKADIPTGLYKHSQIAIKNSFEEGSEYKEEFAIFKNKIISRQNYDDGSIIINGKPVKTIGAELRCRTLIKYNFIICAKFAPYNCDDFSRNSKEYFKQLLKNRITFDEFVEWMNKFPKIK